MKTITITGREEEGYASAFRLYDPEQDRKTAGDLALAAGYYYHHSRDAFVTRDPEARANLITRLMAQGFQIEYKGAWEGME